MVKLKPNTGPGRPSVITEVAILRLETALAMGWLAGRTQPARSKKGKGFPELQGQRSLSVIFLLD